MGFSLAAVLAAASPGVVAQSPAGSFQLGPVYLYPEVEFAVRRDTNIALQPDATRVGDTITYVRPVLRTDARSGAAYYDAGYKGEYARYRSVTNENDDYTNHEVYAGGDWKFDARNNTKLRGQYLDNVDQRGVLQIVTPTPNQFHQETLTALHAYGAHEAAGKFELQAGTYSKNYVNNRLQTAALDHSRTEYGATLLLRVQPNTYASLAARQYRYEYAEAGSAKDSKETFVFAGLRWDVTALTSGKLGIGHEAKKFEPTAGAAADTEFSGIAWEGGLNWRPLFYSSFSFATRRRTAESTGVGDFVVNQTDEIAWTHVWGSRVSTVLTVTYSKDRYSGAPVATAGGEDRQDVIYAGGLRALYAVQRWLKFGAEYMGSTRNSNDDNFDYRRHQSMLFVNVTF